MAVTINADNGAVSGSAGLKQAADSTGVLALQTNGTTAVTVDASQNVGIGTSSPGVKLDISAASNNAIARIVSSDSTRCDLRFQSSGSNSGLYFGNSTTFDLGRLYYDNAGNNMVFATNSTERARIDSSGNVLVTSAAGLGYGTGSGGTVTQATNKGTQVTLNKPTGQITMNNAALAGGAAIGFTLSNSLLATTDNLLITFVDGSGTTAVYTATPQVNAGGAFIVIRNTSGTSYSEAIKWNFAVIKGATS